jgi:hypothetical protein
MSSLTTICPAIASRSNSRFFDKGIGYSSHSRLRFRLARTTRSSSFSLSTPSASSFSRYTAPASSPSTSIADSSATSSTRSGPAARTSSELIRDNAASSFIRVRSSASCWQSSPAVPANSRNAVSSRRLASSASSGSCPPTTNVPIGTPGFSAKVSGIASSPAAGVASRIAHVGVPSSLSVRTTRRPEASRNSTVTPVSSLNSAHNAANDPSVRKSVIDTGPAAWPPPGNPESRVVVAGRAAGGVASLGIVGAQCVFQTPLISSSIAAFGPVAAADASRAANPSSTTACSPNWNPT